VHFLSIALFIEKKGRPQERCIGLDVKRAGVKIHNRTKRNGLDFRSLLFRECGLASHSVAAVITRLVKRLYLGHGKVATQRSETKVR